MVGRPSRLLAIAGAAYLAGLVVYLPARLIVAHGEGTNIADVAGTIWHGEAALAGGATLGWRWAPLRSLTGFGFAGDFTVRSDRGELQGKALLGPRSITLADVGGATGASLAAALFPRLPFACDMPLQVDLRRVKLGGGDQHVDGRILGNAGNCALRSAPGATTAVPPLVLESAGDRRAQIARQGQRRVPLATFDLGRDGAIGIRITQEGAAAFPFAVPAGGLAVDTRF